MTMTKTIAIALVLLLVWSGCYAKPPQAPEEAPTTATAAPTEIATTEPEPEPEEGVIPMALPGTTVLAAFRQPETAHYAIVHTAYDQQTETFAILYAVSDYQGDRPWQTYQEEYGRLQIQLFDKQGAFLRVMDTPFIPRTDSQSEIIPNPSCTYQDGLLTFFAGWILHDYVFFNTQTGDYTTFQAQRCLVDGDYFLFDNGGIVDNGNTNNYVYTLYHRDEPLTSVAMTIEDLGLQYPENRRYMGEKNEIFTLDSQNKTAVIGNDKLTYYLDFNTQAWRMERHYNADHLEELLLTSPDGRWELYRADSGGMGDGGWADLVAKEAATGTITYLTEGFSDSITIGADNMVLFNKISHAELIDLEKGAVVDPLFWERPGDGWCPSSGVGYDKENDWFLITWCAIPPDGSLEASGPIMLDIYDRQGSLLRTIDSGENINIFSRNWVRQFSLEVGDGTVALWEYEALVATITYG